MNKEEQDRLNSVAEKSIYAEGANAAMQRYCFAVVEKFLRSGNILELGPAEGLMTEPLVATGQAVTCVEGSEVFCRMLREKFPSATIVNSLFEEYRPASRFDNIILGHVLEHVEDPVQILSMVKEWLAPGGIIFAAVPNSSSLHRQAGVLMGLLTHEKQLNAMDIHHGHRRGFDIEEFRQVFIEAGLNIQTLGGYWLKPVSSAQIEETWNEAMLQAYMVLGEKYPEIAAEIYVVAGRND